MAEIVSVFPRPFKTQYHKRERVLTNPGNPIKITYAGRYDENGCVVLEETGKVNLYDEIQSHADSCNINLLIKRFANGEVDVLSKVQGFYGDVTRFPSNLSDALNLVRDSETVFESLPVEVRAKFNHNFGEFLSSAKKADFLEMLGIKQDGATGSASVSAPEQKKEVVE